jgi:hypothetical protein
MMQKKFRRGFTLIEAAAVTAIGTLVAATLAPGLKATRLNAQARGSESNLMQIGQGSDMYALDNAGRIFTYNWVPGETYLMPDGKTRRIFDEGDSGSWQNTEILMRRTGRIDGPDRFRNYGTRLAHRRLRHIVLMDYLGTQFPDTMFADPADANLLQWQANPTDLSAASNTPYAAGSDFSGYDEPGGWTDLGVRQRWPFASSYQSTVSAWAPDGRNNEATFAPISATPHLFAGIGPGSAPLHLGRNYSEVIFPSAKVHLFEEFDREQAGSPYFGYDHARPAKLMFDGSVNDWASGVARSSWSPATSKVEWRQRYVPIHTFPVPLSGLGETTLLSQRYRWTLGGLKGVDYPQPLMPAGR